jgi:small subunit ribosomal protein S13
MVGVTMASGKQPKDLDKEKKEAKEEEPKKEKPKPKAVDMRSVVRVSGTDLDGDKKLQYAIMKIRGIKHSMSKAVCMAAKLDPDVKLKSLKEEDLAVLENVIKDPTQFNMPLWMLNRRRDMETGGNLHLTGTDVKVFEKFDIKAMVDMKSYKGVRHMLGLPTRGQRTKNTGRKGGTVGVVRKKMMPTTAKTGSPAKEGKK